MMLEPRYHVVKNEENDVGMALNSRVRQKLTRSIIPAPKTSM